VVAEIYAPVNSSLAHGEELCPALCLPLNVLQVDCEQGNYIVRTLLLPVMLMGGWHDFQSDGGYSASVQSAINDARTAASVNAPSAFEYYPVFSDTLPTYEHTPGTPEQEAEYKASWEKALAASEERSRQNYADNMKRYCALILAERKLTKFDRKWNPECFQYVPAK